MFNGGFGFYVVQFFTAAILILAANTAYQDFPRLSSILARDRYMPSQFMNRGDRLVFSNGIVVLAIGSSLLIYAFHADLTRLIQLYVIGVFTSFTLSQSGMIVHWLRERHRGESAARGWRRTETLLTLVEPRRLEWLDVDDPQRQDRAAGFLLGSRRGPRSRRAAGVGDVAGERGASPPNI